MTRRSPREFEPEKSRPPALLSVDGLRVSLRSRTRMLPAVQEVSFSMQRGEILALVGESGCGKSLTAQALLGLVGKNSLGQVEGSIRFKDRELTDLSEREMRSIRGREIAWVSQDPMTSLNPVYPVGAQIAEVPWLHQLCRTRNQARGVAERWMDRVGIPDPALRARDYPFAFSGGMRQRLVISMGLSGEPDLIIADEPTTALDVTIQAQILDLLQDLRAQTGCAILLITHDLGVVAQWCDAAMVMYAGRIVEKAPVGELLANPTHPYTQNLLASVPTPGHRRPLQPIPGQAPALEDIPSHGCPFRERCALARADCEVRMPDLVGSAVHRVACWDREVKA